jgi:hypothetical protein
MEGEDRNYHKLVSHKRASALSPTTREFPIFRGSADAGSGDTRIGHFKAEFGEYQSTPIPRHHSALPFLTHRSSCYSSNHLLPMRIMTGSNSCTLRSPEKYSAELPLGHLAD